MLYGQTTLYVEVLSVSVSCWAWFGVSMLCHLKKHNIHFWSFKNRVTANGQISFILSRRNKPEKHKIFEPWENFLVSAHKWAGKACRGRGPSCGLLCERAVNGGRVGEPDCFYLLQSDITNMLWLLRVKHKNYCVYPNTTHISFVVVRNHVAFFEGLEDPENSPLLELCQASECFRSFRRLCNIPFATLWHFSQAKKNECSTLR